MAEGHVRRGEGRVDRLEVGEHLLRGEGRDDRVLAVKVPGHGYDVVSSWLMGYCERMYCSIRAL